MNPQHVLNYHREFLLHTLGLCNEGLATLNSQYNRVQLGPRHLQIYNWSPSIQCKTPFINIHMNFLPCPIFQILKSVIKDSICFVYIVENWINEMLNKPGYNLESDRKEGRSTLIPSEGIEGSDTNIIGTSKGNCIAHRWASK